MDSNYTNHASEKHDKIQTPWKIYKKVMMKCLAWIFILMIIFTIIIFMIGKIFFWEVTDDYNLINLIKAFFFGLANFLLMIPLCLSLVIPIIGLKMIVLKKSHESVIAGIYLIFSMILGVLWIFFLAHLDV